MAYYLKEDGSGHYQLEDASGSLLLENDGIGIGAIVEGSDYAGITASDNFNRANGSLGSSWSTLTSKNAPAIVSNAVELSSEANDCGAVYTAVAWPNDQWVSWQVNVLNYADSEINGLLRCSTSAFTCYLADIFGPFGSSAAFSVSRRAAGASTAIQAKTTITVSASDVFVFGVQGSTLTLWQNGSLIWTGSDNNISSGSPGFLLYSNAETVSDTVMGPWAGGNYNSVGVVSVSGAGPVIEGADTAAGVGTDSVFGIRRDYRRC